MVVTLEIPTGRRKPEEVLKHVTVEELDALYDDMDLGEEWRGSHRRQELFEFEQRELEALDALIDSVWLAYLDGVRTFYMGHDRNPNPKGNRNG